MITREQVADLRPGDVVELSSDSWEGAVVRGPLHDEDGELCVGPMRVRRIDGHPAVRHVHSLTVVSRAPRPLYINSDRTEPVHGDVVRVETGNPDDHYTDVYLPREDGDAAPWVSLDWDDIGFRFPTDEALCQTPRQGRNVLLVDGTTGQPVTS